jgi:hypothetical protein
MTVAYGSDPPPGSSGSWIGLAPTPAGIAALLTVGTVGMMITGVQPVVFGALVREGRLSVAELGQATTAEFLALGIGVLVAGALFRPRHLRWYGMGAGLVVVAANLLGTAHAGHAFLADRALAGLAEGILLWLPGCMLARSTRPAFWSGIFITIQTLAQLAYVAIVPTTAMAQLGANGALISLAVTGGIAMAVSPAMPSHFQDLRSSAATVLPEAAGRRRISISGAGIAALAAMSLSAAFQIGLYAYFEPLSAQAGLNPRTLNLAVTAALAAQVAGSTLAAMLSKRVGHFHVLIAWAVTNFGLLFTFVAMPKAPLFVATATVFGFVWLFFMPFQYPLVIDADPTRRAAVLLPGAQLLGGAAGPFLCSLAVTSTDVRGALVVAGLCVLATLSIAVVQHVRRQRDPLFSPASRTAD